MTRNPIQQVSNKLQYRAIGIISGVYKPFNEKDINKGSIKDENGIILDTVVLGKNIPLIKKYIDLKKNHYWIVYPRNKNTDKLHLQIAGIWDPKNLNNEEADVSKNNEELLDSLNLKNNFFSIRGKLVYVNAREKELIIKIKASKKNKKPNNSFKITLKGEISMDSINSFVSLDTMREGNALSLKSYQVVEGKSFEKN
tara:strand:- start:10437 stop:11030 length:594 start_codon:yes stop_codon:yes gene_type:complete